MNFVYTHNASKWQDNTKLSQKINLDGNVILLYNKKCRKATFFQKNMIFFDTKAAFRPLIGLNDQNGNPLKKQFNEKER